jgi:hypothetical protein
MGAFAKAGIADPMFNAIMAKNNKPGLPPGQSFDNPEKAKREYEASLNQNNSLRVKAEKLSSSSIVSQRGNIRRKRSVGLINDKVNETLGADGL